MIVNGVLSDELSLNAGGPQGSVLYPLLFIIYMYMYMNGIADKLLGKTRLYSDDTIISYSSSDLAKIKIVLNICLKRLKEWALKWL